jgi:hypothetical protein
MYIKIQLFLNSKGNYMLAYVVSWLKPISFTSLMRHFSFSETTKMLYCKVILIFCLIIGILILVILVFIITVGVLLFDLVETFRWLFLVDTQIKIGLYKKQYTEQLTSEKFMIKTGTRQLYVSNSFFSYGLFRKRTSSKRHCY